MAIVKGHEYHAKLVRALKGFNRVVAAPKKARKARKDKGVKRVSHSKKHGRSKGRIKKSDRNSPF